MSNLTTTQQPWFLAMLEIVADVPNTTYPPGVATVTDRVPLLPDVRVPCRECSGTGVEMCRHPNGTTVNCWDCHGLGWVPTEEAWKWVEVGLKAGIYIRTLRYDQGRSRKNYTLVALGHERVPDADSVKEVWLAAICQHLRPLAINAEEAEAWVRENIPSA